jgi:uncharacterized protein with FMN-binding domain
MPIVPLTVVSHTAAASHSYRGAAVRTRYGTVQVTISVSGRKLTAISATAPTDRPRSAIINQRAVPKLRSEALHAQSARINKVSGASVTSSGFEQSLQSALTAAHI